VPTNTANEKKIIVTTGVAHFFTHFYELIFPALAIPLMTSLDMSLTEVLKLSFLMYLLYGLGALPWGIASDRFGNRTTLIIFFFGTALGAFLTALSHSSTTMMLSLAVIGFFASAYHPAGMGLISLGVRNRGMALGINGVAGNIGLVSAPFVAGLMNWLVGWKMLYVIIGSLSLLWGILMFLIPLDEKEIHADVTTGQANSTNNHSFIKYFFLLCVIMTLSGLVYRTNSLVLPAYLEFKAHFLWNFFQTIHLHNLEGTKTMAATLLASAVYFVGIFGQLAGGKAADKFDLRWMYFTFQGLSIPFIIVMSFVSEELLIISAALYIFFALGMQPIENSLVAKFTPTRWRSTAYGIKFILTFGVGALAVYPVGWIKDTWNLAAVYLFAAGVITLLVSLIAVLAWISRHLPCRNAE
jgi:MFS family permease